MLKKIQNALRRAGSPFVFDNDGLPRNISAKIAQDIGLSPAQLAQLRTTWPSMTSPRHSGAGPSSGV